MRRQKVMKSFDKLEYRDDFMFGKVMEDTELCRDVLECLLQRPVGELKELQTQKEFRYTSDGKPMRLDVYNEDDDGQIYDAEMQNRNNHSREELQLPKRSRFYQGAIDIDFMNKGNHYKKLPESTVMFICTFDPFKAGLSRYTFRERCDEEQSITLEDGTIKVFYNCAYKADDIPDEIRKFYDYVMQGRAESDLTKRIDAAVIKGRKNEIWRTQYMKEWVIIQDAIEEERELKEKAEKAREKAEEATKKAEEATKKAEEASKEYRERAEKAEARIKELEAEDAIKKERERAEKAEARIRELEAMLNG